MTQTQRPAVILRPGASTDAVAMADLYLCVRYKSMPYLRKLYSEAQVRSYMSRMVLKFCRVTVAMADNRLVGFIATQGDWVDQFYVAPDTQGFGIGGMLMEAAKRDCAGGLRLHVFQRNTAARRFYERHGFTLVQLRDGTKNEEREPDAIYAWTGAAAISA